MYLPLFFLASAALIASIAPSAFAVPAGPKRDIQYCTDDNILGPLSHYLPIQADVTPFCSTLLNIQNRDAVVATTTPISTVYSTTVIIGTTYTTVTSYTTTATVTTTSAVYELKRRNEVELAARAAVTDLLQPIYKEIQARQATARTSTNFDASAISEGLVSACSCLYITPGTNYITATASTSTRSEGVVGRGVETNTFTTIAPGATTTTVLLNSTSNILPVSPSSTSLYTASMSSVSTSFSTSSMSATGSVSASPSSMSSMSLPNSTSSSMTSISTSTNPTSASLSTVSSTTAGPIPTGCPYINGTMFSSSDPCQSYRYVCGVSYPDEDFYNLEESYDSLETCAADVCTHANSGKTPCLGVVWDASTGNCRELMNLANPFYDQSSVGALSFRSNGTSCQRNVSSSPSMLPTTSAQYSMNVSTSSVTGSVPVSRNMSLTWLVNSTGTLTHPTGTGSWLHHNHTRSWNGTWPTQNLTWSRWMMTGYSSGTGVTSASPIPTSNNTCPVTKATSTVTKFATLYSGNYTFTTTETQYINALPNNASTITQLSLVTVVITDLFTATTDYTTTVVNSHLVVTDITSTSVETDIAISTTTKTSLTTETDVATVTESSTSTDTLTFTELDTMTTTTTTDFTEIDSQTTTTTTTTTTVATEIDTATITITTSANPVGSRYGRSWWIF